MRLESYCVDCGAVVTKASKRCSKCGQVDAWKRRDKKQACSEMRAGINANFREFGVHDRCKYCRRECRQYNAPHSVIVFCPRIKQQCQQSASL